jgi:predicted RND superfamily exporter protein
VTFTYKHQKVLFILFALIMLCSLYGLSQLRLNTDFTIFTTGESEYQQRLDQMEDVFGSSNQIIVIVKTDTFDNDVKDTLRNAQAAFEKMENIEMVQGPTPSAIQFGPSSVSIENIEASTILSMSLQMEEFSPITIENDIYYITFNLIISENFHQKDLKEIESILDDTNETYYLGGETYSQYKVVDYMLKILFILPPLAILIILIVFRFRLGAFKPTFLSVLPAALASIITFGIIGLTGHEVSILTAIVPVFTIVIGSADGLHFISHMQESEQSGFRRKEALSHTLKIVGVPMIITTLTSIAGFLSLLSMNIASITDLAVYASVGILIAGIVTWWIIPLLLSRDIVIKGETKETASKLSDSIKKLIGAPSLIISGLLLILGVALYGMINYEFDVLSIYKDRTEVQQNASAIAEIKGGTMPLYILIETNGVLSMETWQQADDIIQSLKDQDLITTALNPYHALELAYESQTMSNIPNNLILSLVYNSVYQSNTLPIDYFMAPTKNLVRLTIFPKDLSNETLSKIEDELQHHGGNVSITGMQYLLQDVNLQIGSMQRNSIIIAISVVFVMLLISLRQFKLAVISTLPIIITISGVYAVMAIFQIPLNITTVIIFSIAIGVGIDYAVHFSSVYNHFGHTPKSIQKTYNLVSKPILANALGITIGMSALLLSPLKIHTYVSSLMWVAMILSVVLTLSLIPTLLTKRDEWN